VIVMTAWGSVDGAVEAMRRGARDYVEKPWDNDRVLATVKTQAELGARCAEPAPRGRERAAARQDGAQLIASARMQPVLQIMERVGPSTRTCSSPASTAPARRSSRAGCTRSPTARATRSSR
jgi:DNA-binding NtrC family response regulator